MRIKLFVGALVMGCAIAVSAVAAYFSVVGLAALFAAAFLPVCIMGTSLEASKLVAAGWLHSNWKNSHVSRLHKAYLVSAILVLMTVTSMGIYGYLMKAHLEQNAPTAAIQVDLDQKQARLDQLTAERDQLLTQEKAINQTVTGYLGNGKAAGAGKFLNQQKGEQENLEAKINTVNDQITQANVDMAPLKKKVAGSEVELGQWKYLAKALGLKDADAAIDILVKMLMFAFDPMAVVMMISGTITLGEWAREKREHVPERTALETLAPEVDEVDPEIVQMFVEKAARETVEEHDNLDNHFDFVADLVKPNEIGLIAQEVPVEFVTDSIKPSDQLFEKLNRADFKPLDEYPAETPQAREEFDLDGLFKVVPMGAPTGRIFQIRPPVVEAPQATHPTAIRMGITDDEFYAMLEGGQDQAAPPAPVVETSEPASNPIAEYFGISDYDLDSIMAKVEEETAEAKTEVELEEFMKKFSSNRLTEENDLDRIAGLIGIDADEWQKMKGGWAAESKTVPNYLDWSNAVTEAHAIDPGVEPTEHREPEPDLVPEPVPPTPDNALRVYVDPHSDEPYAPIPYKGRVVELEPVVNLPYPYNEEAELETGMVSLEEAFAREMAQDQDEELRHLEADMDRVGDRNILLALLEENPTLLEEIMQAYDEAKADTDEPPPAPPAATNKPMNWFQAVNPPGPSRKN